MIDRFFPICLALCGPAWAANVSLPADAARSGIPPAAFGRALNYLNEYRDIRAGLSAPQTFAPMLHSLRGEYAKLDTGERKEALGLLLKAISATPQQAGHLLSSQELDRPTAQIAGEIALGFWSAIRSDKGLLEEASELRRELWPEEPEGGTAQAVSEPPAVRVARSHAYKQLLAVAKAWPQADPELPQQAAAAVESWLSAYQPEEARLELARASAKPPQAESVLGRISAWLFDLDDNIFRNLPTKIVLFHKETGQEKPVSTEEYARVRQQFDEHGQYTGNKSEYKDYEIRKSGSNDSFRNFQGAQLIEDIRFVIKNLPKSEWQGPSFDAFAYALSRQDTAKWVSIITARGHPPEVMLAALKVLQEEGYIKYLPPVENLIAVGEAEDPSAAKIEEVMKVLDRIQATPLGPDAPEVLNPSGRGQSALHLAGFSDDDWGTFTAMVQALAKEVKKSKTRPKGRWPKVKITVFFTGKNDPDHKPGAYVITPDGDLRPVTTDEHGEAYIEHHEHPGSYREPRYKHLPYPVVVRSKLKSLGDAIKGMFVSSPFKSDNPKVKAGDDLLARERQAILDHINDTSIPDRLKRVVLTRYSIDDEKLAKVLILAKEKGIPVTLITDFNVSMEYAFAKGEEVLTDVRKATPKNDPGGRFIKTLLDAGFAIHDKDSKWSIWSQPMFNKPEGDDDNRIDIMHEKSLLLITEADPERGTPRHISYYFGTANLTNHPRYNRIFLIDEELSAEHMLEHSEAILRAFAQGKAIKEIDSEPPLRVYFEDGSFMEIAFTNGKYNPWERLSRLYDESAEDPGRFPIKGDILNSHFVPETNTNTSESLKWLMKVQKLFRVLDVWDAKMLSVRDFARGPNRAGFMTMPPKGRLSRGWAYELRRRVTGWGYLQGVDGVPEKDLSGPPLGRRLHHDKTTLVPRGEDGVDWVYIFTGSLNASNHFDNAELQVMFRFTADSVWPKSIEDSILKVVQADKEHYLYEERLMLLDSLARMTGHSPLDIPLKNFSAIETALRAKDAAALKQEIAALAALGTTLVRDTLIPGIVSRNVQRLLKFLGWYNEEMLATGIKKYPLSVQKVVAVIAAITYQERKPVITPRDTQALLDFIFWDPDISEKKLAGQIGEAWQVLELEEPIPRQREQGEAEAAAAMLTPEHSSLSGVAPGPEGPVSAAP